MLELACTSPAKPLCRRNWIESFDGEGVVKQEIGVYAFRLGVPMGLPEILIALLAVILGGGTFLVVRFLWRLGSKRY